SGELVELEPVRGVGERQRARHRPRGRRNDRHGDERRARWHLFHYRLERTGCFSRGDPYLRYDPGRPDAAAGGDAQGCERQYAFRASGELVELEPVGGDGERQRGCDCSGGRVGHHHGNERRADRHLLDHHHECPSRFGGRDSHLGEDPSWADGAADRDAAGREWEPAVRAGRDVGELQRPGGSGLVTGLAAGSAVITAMSEGKSGTATLTVVAPPPPPGAPGAVTDLAVAGATDTSVTLSFTEVSDGAGQPASYDVRFAMAPILWGSATEVARGTCARPLAGSTIGAKRTCTVFGLSASTAYGFQLIAF